MISVRSLVAAGLLSLGLLATSLPTQAHAVAPAAAPAVARTVTAAVPPGYRLVTDATGTITVLVPDTYTVDTSPVDWNGDGIPDPRIAAVGLADASGIEARLTYVGLPHDPTFQSWDGTCDPNGECPALLSSVPYSDPLFTGQRLLVEGCCASGIYEWVDANADDGSMLAYVAFDYGETRDPAEVAIFETALASFSYTGVPLPTAVPPAAAQTSGAAVFPWVDFHGVPQMGAEPVRGTGCGSGGQVGDVIPDGIWAGFVTVRGGVVDIDLVCVFTPRAAQAVITAGTANIINDDPYYLVVNNNPRLRSMAAAADIQLRDGVPTADGACVEGDAAFDHSSPSDVQAWVNITNGVVTWAFWGCEPFVAIDGPVQAPQPPQTPQPAQPGPPLPPAYPDYSDGAGRVWPYDQFWNVPQLGSEPVRGSGCGAEGQIGPTVPDGLWAGFVDGYDADRGGVWIDLLCIFTGATAQAVLADGTSTILNTEPDYLIVNNSTQTRFVPDGLAAIIVGDASSGDCREGTHLSPEQVDVIGPNRQRQAWIRVAGGVVTWIFYGC
jgi:hypothetical protein